MMVEAAVSGMEIFEVSALVESLSMRKTPDFPSLSTLGRSQFLGIHCLNRVVKGKGKYVSLLEYLHFCQDITKTLREM